MPEYLALGVPVVCNDNPDQQAIIEACGCGVCVPYTAHDYSQAIVTLLSLDAATRFEMVNSGLGFVTANRDYAHIANAVAGAYNRIADKRPKNVAHI